MLPLPRLGYQASVTYLQQQCQPTAEQIRKPRPSGSTLKFRLVHRIGFFVALQVLGHTANIMIACNYATVLGPSTSYIDLIPLQYNLQSRYLYTDEKTEAWKG